MKRSLRSASYVLSPKSYVVGGPEPMTYDLRRAAEGGPQ